MNSIAPTNVVSFKDDKIWLSSGLDEMMFGKTKFSLLLNETGARLKKQDSEWKVEKDWKFDESKTEEERVYFCQKHSGITLQKMIESQDPGLDETLLSICQIYSQFISSNKTLPVNGATGIIVNKADGSILLLPEKTFDRSIANFGKEVYDFYQNCWRDYVASGVHALSFALGVMAYFAVSKTLPFSEEKDLKISDRNFLPVELCVNGIDKKLAKAINSLLDGNLLKENFPIDLLKAEILECESKKHAVSEEKFELQVKAYAEKSQKDLKRGRFVRKHWLKAAAALAFCIFATITTVTIIKENGKKPTVIGLDSKQTVEVFYKGIHTMDTDLMLAAAKDCPQAQPYISQVPQLYVTGQMRSAYNFDSGISTPENWMFFEPDSTKSYSHYIYGITNFNIDGEESSLNLAVPTRKNHPVRKLFAEDGSGKIEQSPDAEHTVHYYLVHNQDNQIAVETVSTVVTLKYIKNRWQILSLNQKADVEIISPLPVSLAYKNALLQHEGKIFDSVDAIRKDFRWLPTLQSLKDEEERLNKKGF